MELNPLNYLKKKKEVEKRDDKKLNSTFVIVVVILMLLFALILSIKERFSKDNRLGPINLEDVKNNEQKKDILGDKENLVSFSILPNSKVFGIKSYNGTIKGGYFFEGNILINILDENKNVLKNSNAMATTDWMTSGPVDFEGNIDFTDLPKGRAFVEIHNDNASGLPENDKSILIPIMIE
jgi:hypothetical protein